jgi:hypothetical protein
MHRDLGYSSRTENGQQFRCSDRLPGCNRIHWALPQLIVGEGAVSSISVDGVEVYRNEQADAAIQRMAALQAGLAVAHLAGVVSDAAGQPVAGAIVSTASPVRAAITDSLGRYEIRTLPAGEVVIQVRRAGYEGHDTRVVLEAGGSVSASIQLIATSRVEVPRAPRQPRIRTVGGPARAPSLFTIIVVKMEPSSLTPPIRGDIVA